MRFDRLKKWLVILSLILGVEVIVMCVLITMENNEADQAYTPNIYTQTENENLEATTQVTTQQTTQPTQIPTTEQTMPLETEVETTQSTEPQTESFLLTFAGDCTLGGEPSWEGISESFVKTVGENYDYPFANVKYLFDADDFTMINLESVLGTSGYRQDKIFAFRGPTAYTQIMTGSSVEAVTLANNHTYDFGQSGYDTTKEALDEAGIAYVEENKTKLFTTDRGLKIGLYADAFDLSVTEIHANIKTLKDSGAEVIICAFHWGEEGKYRPSQSQMDYAQVALEAGAHVVYGHHPHVLQPVEQTEQGVIFYSMGNFSFGGNSNPRDMDSAVMQLQILRDPDGTIRIGELNQIPVRISSAANYNNYQPTPCEEGSEAYNRILEKLQGTFEGSDLVVNYGE